MPTKAKTKTKTKRKLETDDSSNAASKDADMPPTKRRKITHFYAKDPSNSNTNKTQSNNQSSDELNVINLSKRTVFILAHGAGTTSEHPNIINWKTRLQKINSDLISVVTFNFKKPFRMDKLVDTFQTTINDTLKKYNDCNIILIGCSMGSRAAVNLASINGLPQQCRHVIALGYPLYVKRSGALRDEAVLKFVNNDSIHARLLLISGTKDIMGPSQQMNTLYNKVKNKKIKLDLRLDNGTVSKKVINKQKSNNADNSNSTNINDTESKEQDFDIEEKSQISKTQQKCVLKWIDGADHSLKVGKRHPLGMEKVHQNVISIISHFCFN